MNILVMIALLSLNGIKCEIKLWNITREKIPTKLAKRDSKEVEKKHEVHPYIRFEEGYNPKKMPLKSLPLDVNLTINIKNIYGIDEVTQMLGMETTVQMNWIDDRITLLDVGKEHLNLDRITLPPDVSKCLSNEIFEINKF
jgi:hypothetical protein